MLSYTYAFQVDVKGWALSDQVLLTLYPPSLGELLMNIKLATPRAGNLRKLFLQPGQQFGWGDFYCIYYYYCYYKTKVFCNE